MSDAVCQKYQDVLLHPVIFRSMHVSMLLWPFWPTVLCTAEVTSHWLSCVYNQHPHFLSYMIYLIWDTKTLHIRTAMIWLYTVTYHTVLQEHGYNIQLYCDYSIINVRVQLWLQYRRLYQYRQWCECGINNEWIWLNMNTLWARCEQYRLVNIYRVKVKHILSNVVRMCRYVTLQIKVMWM